MCDSTVQYTFYYLPYAGKPQGGIKYSVTGTDNYTMYLVKNSIRIDGTVCLRGRNISLDLYIYLHIPSRPVPSCPISFIHPSIYLWLVPWKKTLPSLARCKRTELVLHARWKSKQDERKSQHFLCWQEEEGNQSCAGSINNAQWNANFKRREKETAANHILQLYERRYWYRRPFNHIINKVEAQVMAMQHKFLCT